MTDGTQVSVAESMLYGDDASATLVRRLGQAATATDECVALVAEALQNCRDADEHEMGKVHPSPDMDEHGRSSRAVWLDSVFSRVAELYRGAIATYSEVAVECAQQERARRAGIDSD